MTKLELMKKIEKAAKVKLTSMIVAGRVEKDISLLSRLSQEICSEMNAGRQLPAIVVADLAETVARDLYFGNRFVGWVSEDEWAQMSGDEE